ncbi:MAG: hypothetical protein Q9163_006360, partial [Psora crenata]
SGDRWPPPSAEQSSRQGFFFRNRDSAPQYPREQQSYRQSQQTGTHRRNHHNDNRNVNRPQRGNYGRGGRGPRHSTSDRPLLRQRHGGDEDLEMLGVSDEAVKYMNPDDVSDSSEEDMDVSDSDRQEGGIGRAGLDGNADCEVAEPPKKKRVVGALHQQVAPEPKWSNPDPYYLLPPVDETVVKKRKDPVKQIRKLRKMAVATAARENVLGEDKAKAKVAEVNQITANEDFISFDMGAGEDTIENDTSVSDEVSDEGGGLGVPGAPTGPRLYGAMPNGLHQAPPAIYPLTDHHDPPTYSMPAYASTTRRASPPVPTQIILDIPEVVNANYGYVDVVDLLGNRDLSLGNRKRTYDDGIKGDIRDLERQRKSGIPSGSLLKEWIPDHGTNPTPWLKRAKYIDAHAGFRLHKEICDFYDFVRPQHFEQVIRQELLKRLQTAVSRQMPHCDVQSFGSFAAGLYLPNADMDVAVLSDSYRRRGEKVICQTYNKLRKFGDFVSRSGLAQPGSVEVIFGAKVPLVKFVDRITSIRVDVSFENNTGISANKTFDAWKQQFPAMPVLVTVIKQFLMMRGLNEVMKGGIGGFSVTCLVTSLLQNMPRVQNGELNPEEHLGELLIEFLDFYGNRLDISRTGIMMEPPGYFDKASSHETGPVYQGNKADRIAIMDPNLPDHDISGGSRNVLAVLDRLSRAHTEILAAMKTPSRISLLDWMLGGDYENFRWQRNHLRQLYDECYLGNPDAQVEPWMESNVALAEESQPMGPFESTKIHDGQKKEGPRGNRGTFPITNAQRADNQLRMEFPETEHEPPKVSRTTPHLGKRKSDRRAASSSTSDLGSSTTQQVSSSIPLKKAPPAVEALPHKKAKAMERQPELEIKSQKDRATQLKMKFPRATSRIPDLLDRQTFKRLVAKFEGDSSSCGAAPAEQPPLSSQAPVEPATIKSAQGTYGRRSTTSSALEPSFKPISPSSTARLTDTSHNMAGTSLRGTILVD